MICRAANGVPTSTMVALLLSVFTVSIGFGIVLPLLPYSIEQLLGGGFSQVARSTGLLTGLYMFSVFLFAPVWGRISDRYGRRRVLVVGLIGFGVTTLTFALVANFAAIYVERALSGLFAAAVTPVALATIGDLSTSEKARARQLTFISLAGISGFLLGPMLGVFIVTSTGNLLPHVHATGPLTFPLAATAVLAFLAAIGAASTIPDRMRDDGTDKRKHSLLSGTTGLSPKLLFLVFIVSAGVGVFEVGLTLRGKQNLGLTQYQIAIMFTECSLVMFIVQAAVFSSWIKPETTRWFVAPALAVLAVGLFLVPHASNFTLMLVVIGAVAASAGILSPILTYWISSKADKAQGAELGKQTAAVSLGAAIGSAGGGLLFNVAALPGASFVLIAGLTLLGFLTSLSLPNLLVTHPPGQPGHKRTPSKVTGAPV